MITKQCTGCGRYFAGQFDGDYTCADCRRLGIAALRPLTPIGVHWAEADGLLAHPPQRVEGPAADRGSARGQAA